MVDRQAIERQAGGLVTFPNPLEAPPGAFLRADNAVVTREGIISKRRGYRRYMALSNPASAMGQFKKRLVVLDGQQLKYDSDSLGTAAAWSGTFSPPLGQRMEFMETDLSLFFTTSKGPYKQDSLTGTPVRAGMPQGLAIRLALTGTGNGWFSPGNRVSYQVTWMRKDANGQEVRGAPSQVEVLTNQLFNVSLAHAAGVVTVTHAAHGYLTGDIVELQDLVDAAFGEGPHSITVVDPNTYTYTDGLGTPGASTTGKAGKAFNVQLETVVPLGTGVKAGDVLEIWRSDLSGAADVEPDIRRFLVAERVYSAGTTMSFLDQVDPTLLGEDLYTNDNRDTEQQENGRPPLCHHMAYWKTHGWYFNVEMEHFAGARLIRVTDISTTPGAEDTITVTAGAPFAYKFSTVEDVAQRKFRLYTTADPSTPTVAQAVEATVKSLCWVMGQDADCPVYPYYGSGIEDPPGSIIFRRKEAGGTAITVQASAGAGDNFTPDLTSALTSSSDRGEAIVLRSKSEQPEAVPLFNRMRIGSSNYAILWAVGLKDTLFVGKEDGIFKITGESDNGGGFSFVVTEADRTIVPLGSMLVAPLDNAIYLHSTQGMTRMVETGSGISSRLIEWTLNRLSVSGVYGSISHLVPYESERSLFVCTHLLPGESRITGALAYNYLTRAWTCLKKPISCGVELSSDHRLYVAHAEDPYILQERKTFTVEDYLDEDLPATVTSSGTTTLNGATVSTITLTYSYREPIAKGWLFSSKLGGDSGWDHAEGLVEAVTDNGGGSFTLTLDRLVDVDNGAALVTMPVVMDLEWLAEDGGNAAVDKEYPFLQLEFEADTALHHVVGFQADHQEALEELPEAVMTPAAGWGTSAWGTSSWGSAESARRSTTHRVAVPVNHARAQRLLVSYRNRYAKEEVHLVQKTLDAQITSNRTAQVAA